MKYASCFLLGLSLAATTEAHHSDAGLDTDSIVSLEGTIKAFHWRNPHVYFVLEAPNAEGDLVDWTVQMGSTSVLLRRGWQRESLAAGDHVTVVAHPGTDGRPYALLRSAELDDGTVLADRNDRPEVTVSASSIEGTWMANASEVVSYPGGFDGFFHATLELTDRAKAAQAAYDEFSEENPESQCIGRPTPGAIISSTLFPIQIVIDEAREIVLIRSEIWDEERTVYMDGRSHPASDTRFPGGHSIGRWEGDTLVVDTANFADHRSPYQIGVPSGGERHVVERYRLVDDGTRLEVEFMLEDPEYIVRPITHTRKLIYVPHIELQRFDCDPQATRRFLPK